MYTWKRDINETGLEIFTMNALILSLVPAGYSTDMNCTLKALNTTTKATTGKRPAMLKHVVGGVGAVLAVTAMTFVALAGSVSAAPITPKGTCGQTFQPRVNGGEAAWSLYCHGNKIIIDGWVKDTKKDGKCAWVKAFGNGQSMPHAMACPKGKKTNFHWEANGSDIWAYLYVA